jgi:hypothetical protein
LCSLSKQDSFSTDENVENGWLHIAAKMNFGLSTVIRPSLTVLQKQKQNWIFFTIYCSFATTVPNRVVKTKLNPPHRDT